LTGGYTAQILTIPFKILLKKLLKTFVWSKTMVNEREELCLLRILFINDFYDVTSP
jgi:hypothetical protein